MKYLNNSRFWLMTTAALVLSATVAQTTAAQTSYQSGAPVMVAAAPSFPTIPAEQIARDVTEEFNPRTGQRELIAAPFDAFEDDPTLASSVRLRSADGAVSIDGQELYNGAILELDVYYNSPSDDPYGGLGFGDASFVNSELAHVVLRDSRILECSTRVENVVYDQSIYYGASPYVGLYRPRRFYSGHSSFGFGFRSSYFGPGFSFFTNSRRRGIGFTNISRSSLSRRRFGSTRRNIRQDTRRRSRVNDRDDRRNRSNTRDRNEDRGRTSSRDRSDGRQRLSDREIRNRLDRVESFNGEGVRSGTRRNAASRGVNTRRRLQVATPSTESRATTPRTQSSATPTRKTQTSSSQSSKTQRSKPQAPRSETRKSKSSNKAQSSKKTSASSSKQRSTSSSAKTRTKSNTRAKTRTSTRSSTRSSRSSSENRRTKLKFFPNDGYGARSVVTSQSVDCAREDKLRVFIPNERLDAARFDGLTVVALDAQGGEAPIYLPPNYIEGFRLAASGQVRPQGLGGQSISSAPQSSGTSRGYVPQPQIEAAPCPSGTTKQADGTCLQGGVSGYPTR